MDITKVITLVGELVVLVGAIAPLFASINKVSNGTKCQLRSEMLRIYYNNAEDKRIRQYEYENFLALYDAYKALKGNSFIDKIHVEVDTWEVVS